MSGDECPGIKEESYDPEYDMANSYTEGTSFGSEMQLFPTIKSEPPDTLFQDEEEEDEEQHADSQLKGADPVRMWTVSSSRLLPLDGAESESHSVPVPVQASLGQVKRVQEESADDTPKRPKRRNVATLVNYKQESEEDDSDSASDKEEDLTCKFCSTAFPNRFLVENHQCRMAIYYCKICYLESTRPRQYTLMPFSEAERHFYLHFHQGFFGKKDSTRTDCISFKFQLPGELRGKKAVIDSEKNLDLLKDFYIGIFDSEGENPYNCGLCGALFKGAGPRVWHVTKFHMEHKNRKCGGTECGALYFSTKDKLLRHMFEAHCDFELKEGHWKCKFCSKEFQERADLEWHFYWHMKPAVKIGASSREYSKGRPTKGLVEDAGKVQFRCTICSYETVNSQEVPLYTASEAHDHLAWHWSSQPPPEEQKNPILNFEKDSGTIHHLYMTPFASHLSVGCKFCGMNISVEGTYRHLESYHKDMIRDPHRCMRPECKHLEFSKKQDFFGHMFLQHVTVVKKKKVKFLCQICNKTFDNRCQVEYHCYFHRIKGGN